MKRIVRGNDFYLHIPVIKIVSGEKSDFDLTDNEDVRVSLIGKYNRFTLKHTISGTSTIIARVEGDQLPCEIYGIEVTGKLGGNDWRSYECGQIEIVECNDKVDSDEDSDGIVVETTAVVMGAVAAIQATFADGYLTLDFPNAGGTSDEDNG